MADIKDEHVVVGWRAWGNPYHGEIVGSTLTLPNATTRTVPAATHNACFEFRVPGAPGGAGASAPAGGSWRDYVLLYGDCKVVYEKEVSTSAVNWLYVRPDGTRWLIKLLTTPSGIAASGASLTLYFRAIKFGDLDGGANVEVNFDVTLPNRGLDTSGISTLYTLPSTVSIDISDITTDGQKCCLRFYQTVAGDETGGQRLPCAFAEITLHATTFTSSSISLVADIEDVAGTRTTSSYTLSAGTPSPCSDTVSNTASGGALISVTDAVMACWYDDTGTLVPIHYDYEQPLTSSSLTKYFDCAEYYSATKTEEAALTISYGAPVFGQYALSITHQYIYDQYVTAAGDPDEGWRTEDYLDVLSAGSTELFRVEIHTSYDFTASNTINYDGILNAAFGGYLSTLYPGPELYTALAPSYTERLYAWLLGRPPKLGDHNLAAWEPDVNSAPLLFAKICSPTLIIVGRTWVDRTSLDRETRIDKAITKHGTVNIAASIPVNTTLSQISAAVHPVTGDIIIGTDGAAHSFV